MSKENDGYLQTKQREIKEKLDNDENREKILANKISAMERQIEQYQTVLDDIKKQSNEKREMFEEMKKFVVDTVQDEQERLHRQINKITGINNDVNKMVEETVLVFNKKIDTLFIDVHKRMSSIEVSNNIFLDFLRRNKKILSKNELNFLASTQDAIHERFKNDKKLHLENYVYNENTNYVMSNYSKKNSKKYIKHIKRKN